MGLVSIRGAITTLENTKEAMLEATEEVLQAILIENKIDIEHIISIHFTATKDLDAVYPAVAARTLGITKASLMCFQELYIEGSLERCIRLEVLVEQEGLTRESIKHQYLREARRLRPDLAK